MSPDIPRISLCVLVHVIFNTPTNLDHSKSSGFFCLLFVFTFSTSVTVSVYYLTSIPIQFVTSCFTKNIELVHSQVIL